MFHGVFQYSFFGNLPEESKTVEFCQNAGREQLELWQLLFWHFLGRHIPFPSYFGFY